MKKTWTISFVAFCLVYLQTISSIGQNFDTYKILYEGFKNPPEQAHPKVYWWWLNGNVDTLRLKEEMRSMKNAGISGFDIYEFGVYDNTKIKAGPAFMGKESLNTIKLAIEEAGKLDMEVGLNVASSWNAGGSWITLEHAAKSIYSSKITINRSTGKKIKLPFPVISEFDEKGKKRMISYASDGKPAFFQEIVILAIPINDNSSYLDTSQIINVSNFFDPVTEELHWHSSGEWEIHRYICSNSGEPLIRPSMNSAGRVIDHFDSTSTKAHFMYFINKLDSALGDIKNSAFKSFYMASYEPTGNQWTVSLPSEFKKNNGYEVYKFIPALFNENAFDPQTTNKFNSDFKKTLSKLMIDNFYKKAKEISNSYGIKINCESGGPGPPLHNVPVEPLKALGALDIPRGEFWINHHVWNEKGIDILRVVKEVSAASHIYNRKIVEEEAFTTFQQWQEGPFDMKPLGDRAFCEGMNRAVIHGFSHNPSGTGYPGIAYHAGTHFNDKRVWWPKIKPFNEYLARISYVLQESDFVADVLYHYGDKLPNYVGHKNSRFYISPGYDYEVVNTEILKKLTVKNKKLQLPNGAEFKLLFLEGEEEINPEVLEKLNDLVSHGAIIIGPRPKKVAILKNQNYTEKTKGLIDKLWLDYKSINKNQGSGKIISGIEPSRMLELINVAPDFSYPDKDLNTLDYVHYHKNELDFYFVRNTTNEWISRECSFRQQNKVPEIWNPVTGEIINSLIYNQKNEYISIPVTLAPYGSLFIVFKETPNTSHYTYIVNSRQHPPFLEYTNNGICFLEDGTFELKNAEQSKTINNFNQVQTLEGAWELYFPKGWGTPQRVILPKLNSWTEIDNKSIKYFSGTATYKKEFQYDINSNSLESPRVYLDLGNLSKVGEVWLNDKHLGIAWAKPFRFDITEILQPGNNTLVIEISNTWSNRITGDAINAERYTNTNIKNTKIKGLNTYLEWVDVPLIESGLFGPVTINTVNVW